MVYQRGLVGGSNRSTVRCGSRCVVRHQALVRNSAPRDVSSEREQGGKERRQRKPHALSMHILGVKLGRETTRVYHARTTKVGGCATVGMRLPVGPHPSPPQTHRDAGMLECWNGPKKRLSGLVQELQVIHLDRKQFAIGLDVEPGNILKCIWGPPPLQKRNFQNCQSRLWLGVLLYWPEE